MNWVKTNFLGKGSYGTVSLAEPLLLEDSDDNDYPELLAVKSACVDDSSSLVKEGQILSALNGCPQIIRCYGEDVSIEKGEEIYSLLLEYAPGGSLSDLIGSRGGTLMEFEISMYAYMLLTGLREIHDNGIVHCDLKPANILIFPSIKGGILVNRLKIADFGLGKRSGCPGSFFIYEDSYYIRGTPCYSSPESLLNADYEPPMDIWAFGLIMLEIITGSSPYSGIKKMDDLLDTIAFDEELPKMPSIVSKKLKDFLSKCFIRDAKERWTANMLLNHPFVVDNYNELYDEEITQINWEDEIPHHIPWSSRKSSISTRSTPKRFRFHPYEAARRLCL